VREVKGSVWRGGSGAPGTGVEDGCRSPSLLLLDESTEGIQPSIIKGIGRAIDFLRRKARAFRYLGGVALPLRLRDHPAVHHKPIPSFHSMTAVAGGTNIRCAPYATFGTQQLSTNALEALQGRLACLLGQHGQIALGTSLASALWLAVEVETLSRMYVQALVLGEPPVLPEEEMARVMEQMRRMSYGHASDLEGVNDTARRKGPP
jgi:hypothetical protein